MPDGVDAQDLLPWIFVVVVALWNLILWFSRRGIGQLDKWKEATDDRFVKINERLVKIDQTIVTHDERFDRLSRIEAKLDKREEIDVVFRAKFEAFLAKDEEREKGTAEWRKYVEIRLDVHQKELDYLSQEMQRKPP